MHGTRAGKEVLLELTLLDAALILPRDLYALKASMTASGQCCHPNPSMCPSTLCFHVLLCLGITRGAHRIKGGLWVIISAYLTLSHTCNGGKPKGTAQNLKELITWPHM